MSKTLKPFKKVILKGISDEWIKILDTKELDNALDQFSYDEWEFYSPKPDKWFEAFRLCVYSTYRVVILGHDDITSHGLCFSSLTEIPPAYKNIYLSLKNSGLIKSKKISANLTNWALQGVLLLNTSISFSDKIACKKIWKKYTKYLLNKLAKDNDTIFLLWGTMAQKIMPATKSIILKYLHPDKQDGKKFVHCTHFIDVNNILIRQKDHPIEWDPYVEINIESGDKKEFDDVINSFTHLVFTDGSCKPNNKSKKSKGGYAALYAAGVHKNVCIYGHLSTDHFYASNIRAEGIAIINAIKYYTETDSKGELVIVTDSQFWIDMVTKWMPKWKLNGIDFKTKSNPDITQTLHDIYDKSFMRFIFIPSHDKAGWSKEPYGSFKKFCHSGNDYVDFKATSARTDITSKILYDSHDLNK